MLSSGPLITASAAALDGNGTASPLSSPASSSTTASSSYIGRSIPTGSDPNRERTLTTKAGRFRYKHGVRAACRAVAFLALVGVYSVYNYTKHGSVHSKDGDIRIRGSSGSSGYESNSHGAMESESDSRSFSLTHRHLVESYHPHHHPHHHPAGHEEEGVHFPFYDQRPPPLSHESSLFYHQQHDNQHHHHHQQQQQTRHLFNIFQEKSDPTWLLAIYIFGILYTFLAIAIVCDEFFVPALEEMSTSRHLNLSMDVSGATLMAAGGSAPELFTSFIGTFTESSIGFGTIVGSAVFNVLFVIGMCSLLSKEVLSLTWWPLFRDSIYYAIGLTILAIFVGVTSKNKIELWEAIILFILYLGYILLMYFNRRFYKYLTGKELPEDDDSDDDENEENGDNRDTMKSFRTSVSFRRHTTFRAGVLKLLRDPNSWVDTAGVGIVSKLAGDVDEVFRDIDTNGDGYVDIHELAALFEKLDCHVTQDELSRAMTMLDGNSDGLISEKEFKAWYIQSEDRIKERVRVVFDHFDKNHSGSIEREELKEFLEKIEPRVIDEDVDSAIALCYKEGSRNEISFDEFAEWYLHSLVYQKQKREIVEKDEESLCQSLAPPSDPSCTDILKWAFLFPLVSTLTLTIPDVQRPGMGKWCYASFFLSIIWIGVYSYFMVGWAETVGATIGIPSMIMGLTFVAMGTSVPDLLSSVIVARRGQGDMAVSSSIGSNIFDILVGLPVPWIAYSVWPSTPNFVVIDSDGVWISIFILLAMLVFIIIAIHLQGWKLTKTLGCVMFLFYFIFLAQAIMREYL